MVTRGNAPPESAGPGVSQGAAVCSSGPLYLAGCHCAIMGSQLELQDKGCLETLALGPLGCGGMHKSFEVRAFSHCKYANVQASDSNWRF